MTITDDNGLEIKVSHEELEKCDSICLDGIEFQKVKHGKWVLDENPHDGDCRCSACGVAIDAMHERNHSLLNALTGGQWWKFYKYCPWCGARMDGKEEEE